MMTTIHSSRRWSPIVLLIVALVLLTGCDREPTAWSSAKNQNTVEAYEAYLKEHPAGPHANEARAAIQTEQDWARSQKANTITSYNEFLAEHPQSIHANDAKLSIQTETDWAQAVTANTLVVYNDFLTKHPQSAHAEEAKVFAERQRKLDADDFARAQKDNTPESFDKYLKHWPQGRFVAESTSRRVTLIRQGAWQRASAANSVEACEAFLAEYPEAPEKPDADRLLAQLREQRDFAAATKLDTSEGWEKFIAANRTSVHLESARLSLDRALAREAKSVTSAKELAALYRRCHDAELGGQILSAWDDAAFKEASVSGDRAILQQYLVMFPAGRHVTGAREQIDELAWKTASKANTIAAYETYQALDYGKKYAAEAKKQMDDLAWEAANKANTVAAYQAYLRLNYGNKHGSDAKVRMDEVAWEMASKADTRVAYEDYLKSSYYDAPHAKEARKRIAESDYRQAVAENSVKILERLASPYESPLSEEQQKDVKSRLRQAYYDKAVKSGLREDWRAFLTKFERPSWDRQKVDPVTAQMVSNAKTEEERLLAKEIKERGTCPLCEQYLTLYPKGENTPMVLTIYEPLLADAIEKQAQGPLCERYLTLFPAGAHTAQVKLRLEQIEYTAAAAADWYSDYEKYIGRFPDGANVQKAKDRLAFLKANKAVVQCDCPDAVNGFNRWSWTTTFKETGGKIGYRVSGSGQIVDKGGGRWGPGGGSISRGTLTVKPGGTQKDDYWCGNSDTFKGGYADFTWSGEDAGGHPISIPLRVKLK